MAFKVGDRSQCDLHSNGAGTVIAIERVCERLVNELSMKLRKKNGGEIRSSKTWKVGS